MNELEEFLPVEFFVGSVVVAKFGNWKKEGIQGHLQVEEKVSEEEEELNEKLDLMVVFVGSL